MSYQDLFMFIISIIVVVCALWYPLSRFISYTEYQNERLRLRREDLQKRKDRLKMSADIEITIKGQSLSGKTFLLGEINEMLKFMRYEVECFDDDQRVDGQKMPFPDNYEYRKVIIKTEY